MSDYVIRLENVSRCFGSLRAVDRLSLLVPPGIIYGFLGPNGAGKTTTIHLLLGLLEPTSGRVEVLGFDTRLRGGEIRARTGALLEHPGVYEQMSAEDNLEFWARAWHLSKGEREARIKELLARMGLWERRKDRAGAWSRGMKQKLALARVLLHRPKLLLMDEPTAGLDVPSAAALRTELAALVAREGTTVFLTTHNMAEAEQLCGKVAVIRQGKLVAAGSPDELRSRNSHPRLVVVGRGFTEEVQAAVRAVPQVAAVAARNSHLDIDLRGPAAPAAPEDATSSQLIKVLIDNGAQVEEVRREQASLEEVFLTLMQEEEAR